MLCDQVPQSGRFLLALPTTLLLQVIQIMNLAMIGEGSTYSLRGLSAKLQQELKAPLSPPLIQCPPQKTCMTCGPIKASYS